MAVEFQHESTCALLCHIREITEPDTVFIAFGHTLCRDGDITVNLIEETEFHPLVNRQVDARSQVEAACHGGTDANMVGHQIIDEVLLVVTLGYSLGCCLPGLFHPTVTILSFGCDV